MKEAAQNILFIEEMVSVHKLVLMDFLLISMEIVLKLKCKARNFKLLLLERMAELGCMYGLMGLCRRIGLGCL